MDDRRLAPTVGIVGCLAVFALLAVPYLLVDASAVGVYYDAGALNPLLAGLLAVVALVVFAAGRQGRSDAALSAGTGLAFGLVAAVIAAVWAFTVPVDVVYQLSTAAALAYHRWALVLAAALVPLGGAWYARTLGLV